MKLKSIIEKIDNDELFTQNEYESVLERKLQLRAYYRYEQLIMVFTVITNNAFSFRVILYDFLMQEIEQMAVDKDHEEFMLSELQPL